MRNSYCYNLRDALNGQKLVGGMLHADNLDDASRRAIRTCKLTIRQRVGKFHTDTDFIRNDRKVNLHITVHPEYFLDAATVDRIEPQTVTSEE